MQLLLSGIVDRIILNDFDQHIYAFWYSILNYTDQFCDLILEKKLSVKEWDRQKALYSECDTDNLLQLGFSTFFLNRTNVSGVLTGGIIGGRKQRSKYKIDARFPREDLIKKIKIIAARKNDIVISNLDASDLFSSPSVCHTRRTFVNFDPPYVGKGAQLYKNSFSKKDHIAFAQKVKNCSRKWIVTYDIAPLILKTYCKYRIGFMDVSYSVGEQKDAKEYIIFSNNLLISKSIIRANEV